MINILSYIGMGVQSEVCLWTLIGIVRTIFDATLFKVNANLKQVWQMAMPDEISLPLQRILRTMISGVMLVQCFTVYVYLATYIVLLYPVFLEERPSLVLPWLLLAAIRQLLCELTSLALGLGTCVLVGPARPACIKFVITKLISIMPAFYMWTLVFSYYNILKISSTFKAFQVGLQPSDHDYGLELAIRRRRTKSLFREDQLRTKLVARLYGERHGDDSPLISKIKDVPVSMTHSTNTSTEDVKQQKEERFPAISLVSNIISDTGSCEDWYGLDFAIPRDADRVMEQLSVMMLRIGFYLTKEGVSPPIEMNENSVPTKRDNIPCNTLQPDDTDTPPQVGSRGNTASYVREYPNIFMKKSSDVPRSSELLRTFSGNIRNVQNQEENENNNNNIIKTREKKRTVSISGNETTSVEIKKVVTIRQLSADKATESFKDSTTHPVGIRIHSKDNLVNNNENVLQEEVKETTKNDREKSHSTENVNATCSYTPNVKDVTDNNHAEDEQQTTKNDQETNKKTD